MDTSDKKSKSTTILVIVLVLVGIIAAITALCSIPTKPYTLTFANNIISIDGWGSTSINLNTLSSITLLNTSPNIISNDNGGFVNNKIFGNENLENYGDAHCYVENASAKAIYLSTTKGKYLIALENSKDTTNLYDEIIKEKQSL